MDWVDKPQNYKEVVWNFANFARLTFEQFCEENS